MNEYEQRVEERRFRLSKRAQNLRCEAEAVRAEAQRMSDVIPFGQPILVGHHSEHRDRRFRGRMTAKFERSFALHKAADRLETRVHHIGMGGISSDDPDAIPKLEAKLARLEDAQQKMRAANRLVRKNDRAGLATLRFSEDDIARLFTPDFAGRIGFPSYALANNRARIADVRVRIERLRALRNTAPIDPICGVGWTIIEDTEQNRVLIEFEVRTDKTQYARIRANGFVWSPSRKAFVRKRGPGAIAAAERAVNAIT